MWRSLTDLSKSNRHSYVPGAKCIGLECTKPVHTIQSSKQVCV